MKPTRFMAVALLALSACAQPPKPTPMAVAPLPDREVTAPPTALATSAPPPAMDPAVIATAQRNLRLLGYGGKSADMGDAAFQHAILAFEKDQGLTEDGRLSPALAEKIRLVRAALAKSPAAGTGSAQFFYSGMPARNQALELVPPVPSGMVADATPNFLQPLRPGSEASYHLGARAKDGSFKPAVTVSCQVGRIAQTNLPLGSLDTVAVDCHGDTPGAPSWHALYSPALGLTVRQQAAATTRDLVALRPLTGNWPSAARTGLDWALTHALQTPSSAPVEWSSTAVAPHFEIKAAARLSGAEAGLPGTYAAQSCRRFELVQTGTPAAHFPGIACESAGGVWILPGTSIRLAAPANGIAAQSPPAPQRSVRN